MDKNGNSCYFHLFVLKDYNSIKFKLERIEIIPDDL
jgi:hypothetical protein